MRKPSPMPPRARLTVVAIVWTAAVVGTPFLVGCSSTSEEPETVGWADATPVVRSARGGVRAGAEAPPGAPGEGHESVAPVGRESEAPSRSRSDEPNGEAGRGADVGLSDGPTEETVADDASAPSADARDGDVRSDGSGIPAESSEPPELAGDPDPDLDGDDDDVSGELTDGDEAAESLEAPEPLDEEEVLRRADALVRRLLAAEPEATEAWEELCRVDSRLIPRLLERVEDGRATKLGDLTVLVLQRNFARYDQEEKRFIYLIQGLSPLYFDDIAVGKVRRGPYRNRASRVRLTSFEGFPLGVVIRAGMLNRIRSRSYPAYSSERGLARWWRDYWRLATRAAD